MKERKKIYICAPFSGETIADVMKNTELTIDRCRVLYNRGFNPIAPQLYYPRFLDEFDPNQREDGMAAGLEWLRNCDEMLIYGPEITAGMKREIEFCALNGIDMDVNNACFYWISERDRFLDDVLEIIRNAKKDA